MINVMTTERVPIKMWVDNLEDSALEQAKNIANLPFTFSHVALMPDAHKGFGMPIGGVLATKGVIVPNAVGVDISCGVCACKLPRQRMLRYKLINVIKRIKDTIPVGMAHQKDDRYRGEMPSMEHITAQFAGRLGHSIVLNEFNSAARQLGTLGSGNHFLELQKGSDGHIWIMIHSGSRNLGYKVAKHYNTLAEKFNARWFSAVDPRWELAFLPFNEQMAQDYIEEMHYCVEFAKTNRKIMMDNCLKAFEKERLIKIGDVMGLWDVAHNYVSLEHHFGQNVWVHRKGATKAMAGEIGIIPGSQGTSSYIVKGLGNIHSFMSCSHGAGRMMGRNQARKELSLETEKKFLDNQNIIHSICSEADLDEASGAYKNIQTVMENQKDLVEIVTELKPLAVVKG